jgi:prevent-host-death family protein
MTIVITMVKRAPSQPYPVGNFKTHCLRIMETVARTGAPILVTKRGKPLVRVVAAAQLPLDEKTWRARMRASVVLPKNDADIARPSGERWNAEK